MRTPKKGIMANVSHKITKKPAYAETEEERLSRVYANLANTRASCHAFEDQTPKRVLRRLNRLDRRKDEIRARLMAFDN